MECRVKIFCKFYLEVVEIKARTLIIIQVLEMKHLPAHGCILACEDPAFHSGIQWRHWSSNEHQHRRRRDHFPRLWTVHTCQMLDLRRIRVYPYPAEKDSNETPPPQLIARRLRRSAQYSSVPATLDQRGENPSRRSRRRVLTPLE